MLKVTSFWNWFIEGLVDVVAACAASLRRRRLIKMVIDRHGATFCEASGKKIGDVKFDTPDFVYPTNVRTILEGADLDVVVPPSFVLTRNLSPLPLDSAQFLDAFVSHQIERLTPWKATDTFYGVSTVPLEGKPPRLAVTAHVVARSLLDRALAAARHLKPFRLRLLMPGSTRDAVVVPISGEQSIWRRKARRIITVTVAIALLSIVGRLAILPFQFTALRSQTADVESQIEDQKSFLSAFRSDLGSFGAKDLLALRQERPRVVETLEALSASLPDDDHLTSLEISRDEIRVSGVSTKTSDLVPALEGSKYFRDVSFDEPITRLQNGDANKFHLSMYIVAPGKGTAR